MSIRARNFFQSMLMSVKMNANEKYYYFNSYHQNIQDELCAYSLKYV